MFLSPYFQKAIWHTCQLTLRNTYATQAREHPLAIFDAIFKFAAKSLSHPAPLLLFHPTNFLHPRVQKEQAYTLELVFPHASPQDITTFVHAVQAWLRDARRHFIVQSCTDIEQKSLSLLLAKFLQNHDTCHLQELCLNFITPVPYISTDKHRKRHITAEQCITMCLRRIERLYGVMPQEEFTYYVEEARKCLCLPWVWQYHEFRHKAKSTQGTKFINGFMGPLWLQGEVTPLLPVLLFCQDMHLGRRLHSGQGAFQLHRQYPFADTLLQKPSLWHEATKKLFPSHIRDDYTDVLTCAHAYAEDEEQYISQEHMALLREVLAHILLKPLRHGYPSLMQRIETGQNLPLPNVEVSCACGLLPLADIATRKLLTKVSTSQSNDTLQKILTVLSDVYV